ncbi:MAG: ATP-binding protein [Bacteroidales bacterium]|nr:ATP-binding protein [Bacteroidales bacterium]
MEKERLKQIILEQRQDFLNKKTGVEREKLSEAGKYLKLPHVYVISGIRRCGKSTLMRQIAEKYYPEENYFFLNFEDERLFNFDAGLFNDLLEIQIELFGNHKTFFIDEIQTISNFELFIRRLSDSGYKFIISGSNAELLSGELATKLTGRHVATRLQPFSFKEFLLFYNITYTLQDLYLTENRAILSGEFERYSSEGGMPEYVTYKTGEILTRMYEDILIKDIMVRNGISNIVPLRELSRYLISNFGRRYSYNSLQKATGLGSANTAKSYCSFLEQSYLINSIYKYDHSLKKQFVNDKKSYVADHAIIKAISTMLTKDTGRIIENIVANDLIADNMLYYYSGRKECDFVAVDANRNVQLFQVCEYLDTETLKRETEGLIEGMNYFKLSKGIILSQHQEDEFTTDGKTIQITPVWKWLLIK